ncbi:acyl-CoA synthetase, partial [Mycobacteroides abscessus subsp. massiliense]
ALTRAGYAASTQKVGGSAQHISESAAAPKSVIVLDAIPVTAVGKPYKPALRADATRSAVRDALTSVPGVVDVEAAVDDGAIVVTVVVSAGADTDAIAAT